MKSRAISATLIGTILLLSTSSIDAWVNFDRFSRNVLPAFGFENDGGNLHQAEGGRYKPVQNEVYGIVESVLKDEPCYARKCTSNEHCCEGSVCVNVDYEEGNCLFTYGKKLGDLCQRDSECETGLTCTKESHGSSVCRAPPAKRFGEDCNASGECDMQRGMCCQLQRRHHRKMPNKVCSYYKDPVMCIDFMEENTSRLLELKKKSVFQHHGLV